MSFSEKKVPQSDCVKSFLPVYCFSNRTMQQLHADDRLDVAGHYECLLLTLLKHTKCTLEDIGGDGK